ncbi:SpvB-domain-containing protein [Thozetella sp. PMI_491]|nr:SpvB-domain-containing protein [Thozetella sp. PMI_491]
MRQRFQSQVSPDSATPGPHTAPTAQNTGLKISSDGRFRVNAVTGSGTFTYPLRISPGRNQLQPDCSLSYSSSNGNGAFGLGWSLELPQISRRTSKGVPTYEDDVFSDVFVHSVIGDLVPKIGAASRVTVEVRDDVEYTTFVPAIVTAPLRIERLRHVTSQDTSWRVITEDNITSTFGSSDNSLIFDGEASGPKRVAVWLLDSIFDGRGNACLYEYAAENDRGIDRESVGEKHRSVLSITNNRYISSIKYGNRLPNRHGDTWKPFHPVQLQGTNWLFELRFDYGQFPESLNPLTPASPPDSSYWTSRTDPFSNYRYSFEIRTYRLCHRILQYHHMPEELGHEDVLVSATEIIYAELNGINTVASIRHTGYNLKTQDTGDFSTQSLPPIGLGYTDSLDEIPILGAMDTQNFSGRSPIWLNLNGDGPSSRVSVGSSAWYQQNIAGLQDNNAPSLSRSSDSWSPLPEIPRNLSFGHFLDVNGDGLADLVKLRGGDAGFFGRDPDASWDQFKSFKSTLGASVPNTSINLVDVTGDGQGDLLFSQGQYIAWSESLGANGFSEPKLAGFDVDDFSGPHVITSDPSQAIFFADMDGDGLADITRVTANTVCYWPNLGYGRFGACVTMADAPTLDAYDFFSGRRVLLADVDGSGCADLLYFEHNGAVSLYTNQAGNRWLPKRALGFLPPVDQLASVAMVDIHGKGTQSLVWTSEASSKLYFLDLTSAVKPRLLNKIDNGMGLETNFEYVSSTELASLDEKAGRKWRMRPPFSVPLLSRVEENDKITNRKSVRTYGYRHGYYDRYDREFRGFGMVTQTSWDELAVSLPNECRTATTPVMSTKTWYFTGVFAGFQDLADQSSSEYFHGSNSAEVYAPMSVIDDKARLLTPDETRDGFRALTGAPFRIEEYMDDGSTVSKTPVRVMTLSYTSKLLQASTSPAQTASFIVQARETVATVMERLDDGDWRINQSCVLAVDEFFNVTQEVNISYERKLWTELPAQEAVAKSQESTKVAVVQRDFTNSIFDDDNFLRPQECEKRNYHCIGLRSAPEEMSVTNLRRDPSKLAAFQEVPFEFDFSALSEEEQQNPWKVLVDRVQSFFWANDLNQALGLGLIESLALPSHTWTKTYTDGLLGALYTPLEGSTPTVELKSIRQSLLDCGYIGMEDGTWWQPSERRHYLLLSEGRDAASRVFPQKRFYSVVMTEDPLGNKTVLTPDSYNIFTSEIVEPNQVAVLTGYNYVALQPALYRDANSNYFALSYDTLGHNSKTSLAGKDRALAESVMNESGDLRPDDVAKFLDDPTGISEQLLGAATKRMIRCLAQYYDTREQRVPVPNFVARIERQALPGSDAAAGIFVSISYLDGKQEAIQTMQFVESGTNERRWLSTNYNIMDGEGRAVKIFEPAFALTHAFRAAPSGYPATIFRDFFGRVIGTLRTDRSWTKIEHTPWKVTTWDASDLALVQDATKDVLLGNQITLLCSPAEYNGGWAGFGSNDPRVRAQAKIYSGTPTTQYLSPEGHPFAVEETDGYDRHATFLATDVQGCRRVIMDPRGTVVQMDMLDMTHRVARRAMADSGLEWTLSDASSRKTLVWRQDGASFRTVYDGAGRPVSTSWKPTVGSQEITIEAVTYGDRLRDGAERNVVGEVYEISDQSGFKTYARRDIQGHVVESSQALTSNYSGWEDVTSDRKLGTPRICLSGFDLQGRLLFLQDSEGSKVSYVYNQRGLVNTTTVQTATSRAENVVASITYDAAGQALLVVLGNTTSLEFTYDDLSRVLKRRRVLGATKKLVLEDAQYTYDPARSITSILKNVVEISGSGTTDSISMEYGYDAFGRLTYASGREMASATSKTPTPYGPSTAPVPLTLADRPVFGTFKESFEYDRAGNLITLEHRTMAPIGGVWSRNFTYETGSNRLRHMSTTATGLTPTDTELQYDSRGNIVRYGDEQTMSWDGVDQLASVASAAQNLEKGSTASDTTSCFVYDDANKRSRKLTFHGSTLLEDVNHFEDGFRMGTRYDNLGNKSCFSILPISMNFGMASQVVALLDQATDTNKQALRFQIPDHLHSVFLELDGAGQLLNYEEFSPYGFSTAKLTQAVTTVPKIAGYNGKEIDTPTGLVYYGRRYYAPWLGRWISPDPIGTDDGPNVYAYVKGNPVVYTDLDGTKWAETAALDVTFTYWPIIKKAYEDRLEKRLEEKKHTASPTRFGRAGDFNLGEMSIKNTSHLWKKLTNHNTTIGNHQAH